MATLPSFRVVCLRRPVFRAGVICPLASPLAIATLSSYTAFYSRTYATAALRKRIFDDKISHPTVRVLNQETSRLGEAQSLADLLSATDLKKFRVELLSETPQPVVRILTREAAWGLREADKARAKAQRKMQGGRKQLQATWGVSGGDLERKITQARGYLEKGISVDIVLNKKKGVPLPLPKVMAERMDEISSGLGDIAEELNRSIGLQLATIQYRPRPGVSSSSVRLEDETGD